MKPTMTEVYILKISKDQKKTLDKLRNRGIVVSKFVRKAIKEKIERDYQELKEKPKEIHCPF